MMLSASARVRPSSLWQTKASQLEIGQWGIFRGRLVYKSENAIRIRCLRMIDMITENELTAEYNYRTVEDTMITSGVANMRWLV